VAVDGSGNAYITGTFSGTYDFDPGPGTTNLSTAGTWDLDAYVSKFDSSGNLVWAKSFSSTGTSGRGYSVAVDGSGSVYTTGHFDGTSDFDPGAGTANLTAASGLDPFVSKLDSSGNYVWARSLDGGNFETVAVDGSGNVYITGDFYGTVDFDPGEGIINFTSSSVDQFFVKLDSSGNLGTGAVAGVTVALSGGSTSVSEAGGTDSFTVVLDAQPSSDVVLSVGSSDTGEATVAPAQLTFTASNWYTAQTITVAGVDDDLTDGTQNATVTVSVVDGSSDDAFDPLADQTVAVTNADNDSFGVSVVQSDGSTETTESGGTDSFTVTLNTQPASDVVVAVSSSDTGEVTVAPATLTFNSGNWDTGQTVTVTGVADTWLDGTQNATVTLSVVDASSDDDYDSVADVAVSVTNADVDSTVVATTTTVPTTTTVAVGSLSLSVTSSGTDGVLEWTPEITEGLTSFTLAWRDPSGAWQSHSSHAASTMSHTLVGLAEGTHSFQVLASYADGTTTLSNDASIVVTAQAAVTPPEVAPFDCSAYPALIQVIRADGVGVDVKQLDLDSGGYSLIYSIPFNRTAPVFEMLNAVGLHPVDRVAYGLMKFADGTSYLVRFDDRDVAFLAKVPHSPAGTVDDDGSFLWATSDGLYRIEDVESLPGFGNRGAATDLSAISPMIGVAADTWDLAAVQVDLGDGEAPYAMGFTGGRQLRIYRYDNSPGSWLLAATTADGSNSAIPLSGFGAAWSHEDEVYFAANSGHGVYEVLIPTIDLTAGTVTVRRVANSAKTAKNDGTNCVGIDPPPPTTTTTTTGPPTTTTGPPTTTTGPPTTSTTVPPAGTTTTTTGPPATSTTSTEPPTTSTIEPPTGATTTEPPAGTTTTTTEPPAGTTTTEPPATTLSGAPEPTTSTTEEPASPETQDSDNDGFTDREEINQLGTDPFDADDPGGGVIRQSLTAPEAERTGGSTNWWKPAIAALVAGLLLLLAVRRLRCQHCGKRLTDRDGVLVDPDDNPDCVDNPDDDHHQLKRK
jgi:hypothetical protein